jgi:uncharacterized protein
MLCPKCNASMEKVPTHEGVADRCTQCKGLWFDMLEYEDLRPFAKIIDTGDAETGARYDAIDMIDCPLCPNSRLIRMVDARHPHVRFEICPTCFGRFYDAGEFREASGLSLGELLRRLFAGARE